MADPDFFNNNGPFKLSEITEKIGAQPFDGGADMGLQILDVAALHERHIDRTV